MKYNLSIVFNKDETMVLTYYRKKEPYKGLYNFIGGKIENNEDYLESAYRELFEETNISKNDIKLDYIITYIFPIDNVELHVYAGKLNKSIQVKEEINKLFWMSVNENFFDKNKFAGEGNMGHIMELIKLYKKQNKIF